MKRVFISALTSLRANMVEINREHWLKDGEDCEKSASIHTCQAIVYVNQEMFKKEGRKWFI